MYKALLVMFLLVAVSLVVLIMLQQNKSADTGASLGGASPTSTLFGSSGSGNFITRMTAVLATMFFILSLVLSNLSSNNDHNISKWDNINQTNKINKAPE